MARCYRSCKHYYIYGFCGKYNEIVRRSNNFCHYGLPLHPLDFLELYYSPHHTPDVSHLMQYAEKFLEDDVSKNIVQQYKSKGKISYKQRKYLVYNLMHCYEDKESRYK